jgi:multidrug transporter EmrE-like cation transporter
MQALWPIALAVATYAAYQIVLKSARPEVNILGVLSVAYLAAFALAGLLWFRNQDLGINRLSMRDMITGALIGWSIVGIEFGFAAAFRSGWPLNTAGAVVNVAVALLVVPIGYFFFTEGLNWTKALGLLLCCCGLVLVARA